MNEDKEQPYVDWMDEDFKRGYTKTNGAIIFEALSNYTCEIVAFVGKYIEKEEVIRTTSVPFTVYHEGVVISSILSKKIHIPIPQGEYLLVVQATPLEEQTDDELYKVRYELFFEERD